MRKNIVYKILIVIGLVVGILACQPDEYELGEVLSKDELHYEIMQDPNDPNMVILESLTPNVTPHWITPLARSTKMKDTIKLPFPGSYDFAYGVMCAGGYVQDDTVQVEITTVNTNYVNDPLWALLTGGVGQSKTWYFDFDADGVSRYFDGPLYFYGTDNGWLGDCYGDDCWNWNPSYAGNEWLMPTGDYGSMTFDLIGNANLTVSHTVLGREETGTYFLDADAKTLSTYDAFILHDENRDGHIVNWGDLKIMSLTEDYMQLASLRDKALSGEDPCLYVYNFISKDYYDNWVPEDLPDPEPPYNGDANTDLTTDVSTSKTWEINLDYPYNWHGLDGSELNELGTLASDPAGFAFTTWAPPYDEDIFSAISITLTKGGDLDGTYSITTADDTFEGTYVIDESNNIDFGQPITFFSGVGGWLTFGTTADNILRIIKTETDALGNIEGLWLGQRASDKDEYLSIHLQPGGNNGGGEPDPTDALKKILSAKTWKLDSERTHDVATGFGAEQGPVIFSDFSTWAWNPLPGEHYAAGEADVDYGTMKFETDGTITVNQRKRIYTYVDSDSGETVERHGWPEDTDVLENEEVVTLSGSYSINLDENKISMSVGMVHPWTCDYFVLDWGDITIYRIEENVLLLQVWRDQERSGEDAFLMTYVFVPAE